MNYDILNVYERKFSVSSSVYSKIFIFYFAEREPLQQHQVKLQKI